MPAEEVRTKLHTVFSGRNIAIKKTIEDTINRKLEIPPNHRTLAIQPGDPDAEFDIVVKVDYEDLNKVKIAIVNMFTHNPPIVDVRLP